MRFTEKVKKKLRNGSWYPLYNRFYEKTKLKDNMILLESRSGNALESNILAILAELQKDPYRKFEVVLSVRRGAEPEIREKLQRNSIHISRIARTGSLSYYKALSQAKYLVNDVTFPGRFIKKEGQIYLNTWHGTPLKKMGRDNRQEAVSVGNMLRNFLDSDYLVFPNRYMEEKMSQAYMLSSLYRGTVLREGYPRNDIFRRNPGERQKKLLEEAGFQDKKLLAYLPTFRGLTDSVDRGSSMDILAAHLKLWDGQLREDELLLVKLHPFLHGKESFEGYRHIRPFPTEWDTYEGLSLCSTLITDYSSVFYDFANAGRQIILFAYDRKEYESGRGMYEDIGKYPFCYTEDPGQVIPLAHQGGGVPDEAFMEKFATYEDGRGTEKICRHVFLGDPCCRTEKYKGNGKKNILLYGGDLGQNGITTALFSMLAELDLTRYNYFLSFRTQYARENQARLAELPRELGIYPLGSEMNMDLPTMCALMRKMKGSSSKWADCRVRRAYQREWKKHFGGADFSLVIHYNGYEAYVTSLLEESPCPRIIWVHNDMVREIAAKGNQNPYLLKEAYNTYDRIVPVSSDLVDPVTRGLGADPSRVAVIPNCLDYESVLARAEEKAAFDGDTLSSVSLEELQAVLDSGDTKFISIGRFSPEKGHKRLLEAFEQYWKEHPGTWMIIIGGNGELYEETLAYAGSLSAKEHIILIRSMRNPMPVLKKCDLFLLSSYYEGHPLVLMEADALGVPVMACDVSGPRGFLTKYGGNLLENSAEGILRGMELFAEGKVKSLRLDYRKMNRESVRRAEALIGELLNHTGNAGEERSE